MSARLIGNRADTLLGNRRALARFIQAWNDGVEVSALSRRFGLSRSACSILASYATKATPCARGG